MPARENHRLPMAHRSRLVPRGATPLDVMEGLVPMTIHSTDGPHTFIAAPTRR